MQPKWCPECQAEVVPTVIERPQGPHEADIRCPTCERHLGFKPKAKNIEKLEKRPEKPTAEQLGVAHCELCRRDLYRLGKGWLEVHHLDGEPRNNERVNLLVVCVMCHRQIHLMQTYVNNHLTEYYERT